MEEENCGAHITNHKLKAAPWGFGDKLFYDTAILETQDLLL